VVASGCKRSVHRRSEVTLWAALSSLVRTDSVRGRSGVAGPVCGEATCARTLRNFSGVTCAISAVAAVVAAGFISLPQTANDDGILPLVLLTFIFFSSSRSCPTQLSL